MFFGKNLFQDNLAKSYLFNIKIKIFIILRSFLKIFNQILFSGLLGYFIDSTRSLTYGLPYTKEDLRISPEYGSQLAAITGETKRRFMEG